MKFKHFDSASSTLAYAYEELVASLEDDYALMQGREFEHYNDLDRSVMKAKIHDIKQVKDLILEAAITDLFVKKIKEEKQSR